MISYLLKRNKSERTVRRIFRAHAHPTNWSEGRFYLYVKKIKESVTHYVNEGVLPCFMEIHEPNCELYSYEEQHFYMKVCRIAIRSFLHNDAVIISLTSARMSHAKRNTHLVARDALLRKFLQLAQQTVS
jgi:hypothetical protein